MNERLEERTCRVRYGVDVLMGGRGLGSFMSIYIVTDTYCRR